LLIILVKPVVILFIAFNYLLYPQNNKNSHFHQIIHQISPNHILIPIPIRSVTVGIRATDTVRLCLSLLRTSNFKKSPRSGCKYLPIRTSTSYPITVPSATSTQSSLYSPPRLKLKSTARRPTAIATPLSSCSIAR
jgi:hypothetical protein